MAARTDFSCVFHCQSLHGTIDMRRIFAFSFLGLSLALNVAISLGVEAADHIKPPATAKSTTVTTPSLARWADSVAGANRQRYCDPNLTPEDLLARLDSAPPDTYRTADVLLELPADFHDKPVDVAVNRYMKLMADMDRIHSEYNGLFFGNAYAPSTTFYLGKADRIRVIPVGPGCALSRAAGFTRSSLSDYPDMNKLHLPLGRGPQTIAFTRRLVDTKFLPHDPVDEIYYGGVESADYKPADYLVIFVSGLSRAFTRDAIAYQAKDISIKQTRIEDANNNLVKKFPITVREVRLKRDDADIIPVLGVANDIDTYYQLRARAFHDSPPDAKRKLFAFSNEPDELGKAEIRLAMMSESLAHKLPVEERSHMCVAPKATCQLDEWTPIGQSCFCQYIVGWHTESQLVDMGTYSLRRQVPLADYANSDGRVVSEK